MNLDTVRAFYDETFAETFLVDRAAEGEDAADRLIDWLDLRAGSRVLDLGCGDGRVARPLAVRGCEVLAVDAIGAYLARGRGLAGGNRVSWFEGDITSFHSPVPCDAAFCWHTSFGYGDVADARRTLASVRRSLRAGGRFLLDVGNLDHVVSHFRPTWTETWVGARGPVRVERASAWAPEGEAIRLSQRWTYHREGAEPAVRSASVLLFPVGWLVSALAAVGLYVDAVWGDQRGAPWSPAQPRIVVRATARA